MRRVCTCLMALALGESGGYTTAADLAAGVTSVDITPPQGWRLCGYFHERINTATHDPLHAKAAVLRQGETRMAMVFCDLIGVPAEVSSKARMLASTRTGIPVPHIVVAGTHSHTGPLYFGASRDDYHGRAIARHGRDACEPIDYPAQLVEKIATAIERADAAVRPVVLEAGLTQQDPLLSFNRRFHMKDGTVRFNPGQKNPDIVRPAGPIDSDVGVVVLRDRGTGAPLATLTVLTLHLDTTGGTEYSADYPYYLEKQLKGAFGPALTSLFGVGCCGDINHIDVTTADRRNAEAIGTILAKMVQAEIPRLRPLGQPQLAARSATVDVPLQRTTPEQVAKAKRVVAEAEAGQTAFMELVEATKILDLQTHKGPTLPLEVQVLRIGAELAVVTLPGEVFVELGLAIKRASPFKTTLVIELANEYPAYIPTRKAFAEGSYETVNSRILPGGGEMLVDAAVKLLKELAPSAPEKR
ncbi:MAG TPA: hypothetical protein PKY77_04505 [Phycisphaerae bacterium]|nr:hypothetical protein [Phycisphaerae bacterium]HRY67120.1 hypothetical protein [Phycisphaerae bacterium]HSA26511.1 hypothetical protein [Phycisphaerae bacterium]